MAGSCVARCRRVCLRGSSNGLNCIGRSSSRTGSGPAWANRLSASTRLPSIYGMYDLVDVTDVEVVGEFRLRLTFEDGTIGDVDYTGRVWNGVLEPLGDPEYFARVFVDRD